MCNFFCKSSFFTAPFEMGFKEDLIMKYKDKIKRKKSFKEFCQYIEENFQGTKISFDLVSGTMRTMFFYNLHMYKKTHNFNVKNDELNICLYLIPNEGMGKKYYEERYVDSSIKGYERFIYVIIIEQLEYYMDSNSDILFTDLAIERGISNKEKEKESVFYIEYLSRIETKEHDYYRNGVVI